MRRRTGQRAQHGIAAIEFAVILSLMLMLLPAALFFGRVFWQYNTLQKACRDALRYMASVPQVELSNATAYAAAVATTRQMVTDALDAAHVSRDRNAVDVHCHPAACGLANAAPATIELAIAIVVHDDIFVNFTGGWMSGQDGISFVADITVPYVPDIAVPNGL